MFTGYTMKIEQNTLSRDWIIKHEGRTFFINFTESDGQTLAMLNRDNWEISEQTAGGIVELNGYIFSDTTQQERLRAEEEAALVKKIISFCIENWDNQFIQELWQNLVLHADNQK